MELSSDDEFVPILFVDNMRQNSGNPFSGYCPGYLVGPRHYHTYIKGTDSAVEGEVETPLAFMLAYTTGGKTIGRFCPEGEDGKPLVMDDGTIPRLSLLFQFKDGLFANYWTKYDEPAPSWVAWCRGGCEIAS